MATANEPPRGENQRNLEEQRGNEATPITEPSDGKGRENGTPFCFVLNSFPPQQVSINGDNNVVVVMNGSVSENHPSAPPPPKKPEWDWERVRQVVKWAIVLATPLCL